MDNFNQLVNDPTIFSVIKAFQAETFAKLNVMRIGVIDEILANNEVRCSITNKKLLKTNPDGTSTWRDYPPIFAKVWYMIGNDFPLKQNMPCLLLFNDREFTSFFNSKQVSPLANTLMHDLSYCICIPLNLTENDGNYNLTSDVPVNITSDTEINLTAPTINLTASAVNITGTLTINGQPYLSHTHSNGNEGAPTGSVII